VNCVRHENLLSSAIFIIKNHCCSFFNSYLVIDTISIYVRISSLLCGSVTKSMWNFVDI
jgi:hypothetical protein